MIGQQQAAISLLLTLPALSLHHRLIDWLATPDVAISVLCAGVLLIFLECNLPGAILPGAVGLFLLLSGAYGLALLPLRPSALLALLGATAVLALSTRMAILGIPAVAGTCGLMYGFWTLIDQSRAAPRVHPSVAICAGLLLGTSASLLGRVAEQARRNKTAAH